MPFFRNIPGQGADSWKYSVNNVVDLPSTGNLPGDAAVVEATNDIYIWNGSAWIQKTGAGSGSNSFSTWQVPNGTSPVADSDADTMTLTSSDSSVIITGNSVTDTIDFKASDVEIRRFSYFSNP
jgi:hypothetical protein